MTIFLFTLLGFSLGSVPFALYLARWSSGKDIRSIGDGNPGATNAWRAGGWRVGLPAYFLEVGKGVVPVLLARQSGLTGWSLLPIALAPTLGHVFSPLLRGRGGKGLATILGVWIGLSGIEVPLVILGALIPLYLGLRRAALSVLISATLTLSYFIFFHHDLMWIVLLGLQGLIVLWTHRQEVFARPNYPAPKA